MSSYEFEALFVPVQPQEGVQCHSLFCHKSASWLFAASEILLCESCYILNRDNDVCPYCGKWYSKQMTHCPHCGWVFNPLVVAPGLTEQEGGPQSQERTKTGLETLIALVSPSHMAWHEGFKFAVICKLDGSLWVRDVHDSTPYEYPARDANEVLAILGETARDRGWRLL